MDDLAQRNFVVYRCLTTMNIKTIPMLCQIAVCGSAALAVPTLHRSLLPNSVADEDHTHALIVNSRSVYHGN